MIHIEQLTKYYSELCAVDHIDLDIQRGEILGLLGPNGAGKTTTLRMLAGFFKPTSGTIRIHDYMINKDQLEIKKLIGYLPESAPLYHDMLVFDYLNYIAGIRELDTDRKVSRMRTLADTCGIGEVMHKTIGELSKGYKQRVGLAHAMMADPEILVLDEPTSGLDPNQIVEIREIIKQIGKEKTVILSTHILSEAEATCDRIVIINKGKIVADDSAHALKSSAGEESIVNISLKNADFQSVENVLKTIKGFEKIEKKEFSDENVLNLKFFCKPSSGLMASIYEKIKAGDWILLEFYQETKTLERIFQELTREI